MAAPAAVAALPAEPARPAQPANAVVPINPADPAETPNPPHPPTKDGRRGWLVVAGSFWVHFVAIGLLYSYGVLFDELLAEFGAGEGVTALPGSLMVGVMTAANPVVGPLIERHGHRRVATCGAVLMSASVFLASLSADIWMAVALYGVCGGCGLAAAWLPSVSIVQHYFDRKRGLAQGVAVSGSGVGNSVMALVLQALVDGLGWRGALRVVAGLLLVSVAAAAVVFVPLQHAPAAPAGSKRRLVQWALFADWRFRQLLWAYVFFSVGYFVPFTHLLAFAAEEGLSGTASIISVLGVANTLGRAFLGQVADLPGFGRLPVMIASMAAAGLVTCLLPLLTTKLALFVYAALFGAISGSRISLVTVVIGDIFGVARISSVYGTLLVAVAVSSAVGPPLAGWLFEATGGYTASWLMAGATMMAGAPFLVRLWGRLK